MGGAFRWPPVETPGIEAREAPPLAAPPRAAPRRSGFRSLLAELEELWLAPDAPPIGRRMAESGWRPDELGAWCDRCGVTVGPHEENEFGCSACRGRRLPWDRAVRLGEHAGELRRWIHELKFTRFRSVGSGLGRELGRQLRSCGLPGERVVVCPMPTSWRRRTARGIDHAGVIARGVAAELGAPVARPLRRRHRASQQSLPASARERNVAGAFTRRPGVALGGRHVVVVDDVLTTGATARAACRALRRGAGAGDRPASVWLAVLAAAARPGTGGEDPANGGRTGARGGPAGKKSEPVV